jgi:hypothetical protein
MKFEENDYLFNKKKENFFTQTLFSDWIIEMDPHKCGRREGGMSDETTL